MSHILPDHDLPPHPISRLNENDMKQKLKQSLDKIKKPSTLAKCVKMSHDEIENIKNGIINGDSLINIQHQHRELQSKLKNSNSTSDIEIVGGRLKFYKGKQSKVASVGCFFFARMQWRR